MMYRVGAGVKILLQRTAFNKTLTTEIPTDLAAGIRVLGIERDKVSKTAVNLDGSPKKFHTIIFQNTRRAAGSNNPAAQLAGMLTPEGQALATLLLGGNRRQGSFNSLSRAYLHVFEGDTAADGRPALELFDGIEVGDVINASVTRMPNGPGYRAVAVEKASVADQREFVDGDGAVIPKAQPKPAQTVAETAKPETAEPKSEPVPPAVAKEQSASKQKAPKTAA